MIRKSILLAVLLVAVGAFVAATLHKSSKQSSKLQVVASYYPLYDFAKNVGGNKVQVSNMTPAGAEPHDYEPSPRSLVDAQKADVFIFNGGTLEPWTGKFIQDYHGTLVKGGSGIPLLKNNNPHFWLDPLLAQKIVDNIRDGLVKADPANKTYYLANAKAYNAKLAKLDADIRNGLQTCKLRTVVSSHDAFGYYAARYGLDVIAIAGMSPDEEPSAARLAELSNIVREKGIKYIFFESLVSPRLADTIAQETGAKTQVFDPVEGLSDVAQKQGKNYISVQRENLKNLRAALACS